MREDEKNEMESSSLVWNYIVFVFYYIPGALDVWDFVERTCRAISKYGPHISKRTAVG